MGNINVCYGHYIRVITSYSIHYTKLYDTNTPPNSAFTSIPAGPAPVVIAQNASVSFYDQSTNVPTGWNWVISGTQGTDWAYINSTSASSQDPQVTFYNVGTYDVTLTASNSYGVDATPAIETGYIQVVAPRITSYNVCYTKLLRMLPVVSPIP